MTGNAAIVGLLKSIGVHAYNTHGGEQIDSIPAAFGLGTTLNETHGHS